MESSVVFQIKVKYETHPGEEIYIYGDSSDFGNWKQPKFKLKWSPGHIWQAEYRTSPSNPIIKFKFVCHSNSADKWEEGENRLLDAKNTHGLPRTSDGKYVLDCVWNHYNVNFNIHYVLNPGAYMRLVIGTNEPDFQKKEENPLKMELLDSKEITAIDGNTITGFWSLTVLFKNTDKDFIYRYSIYDPKNGAIWEREPNRRLHLCFSQEEKNKFYDPQVSSDECQLLTNSFLEKLDVNFVANLVFNKMGDKNIFIGPYLQTENDFKLLLESHIDTILNVQSDKDIKKRQINLELLNKKSKEFNINLIRYPIEDYNHEDLLKKLKGAGDLLNNLLKEGKTVYVHCTAGMSRAAATVIIYLVIYENFSVKDAVDYCKKYRPVICPNLGAINEVAAKYKPGSEMRGDLNSVFERNMINRVLREYRNTDTVAEGNDKGNEEGNVKEVKKKVRKKVEGDEEEKKEKPKKKIVKKKVVKKKKKKSSEEQGED